MTKTTAPLLAPKTINEDYWTLWIDDIALVLPCKTAKTFLAYLKSPSTTGANLRGGNIPQGFADVTISGPRADNGERFIVSYRLTGSELWGEGWTDESREELMWSLRKLWEKANPLLTPLRMTSAALRIQVQVKNGD